MRNLRIPDFEVVLLDNGSREFDPRPFAEAWPGVVIRSVADNLGPALGYNRAVEAATGEYILLLDSDTLFPSPTGSRSWSPTSTPILSTPPRRRLP